MISHSLKGKIIFPTVIVLFSLVVIMTVYSSFVFFRFSTLLNNRNISSIANNLKSHLEKYEHNTMIAAVSAAVCPGVINAVNEGSAGGIIEVLKPLMDLFDVNYFTITDENGIVLARTYQPSSFGDDGSGIQNIRDAMNGKVSTYYETGPIVKISIHTGAPVYDAGRLIGVISAGVRLDDNASVDRLKDRFNAEFSVFSGNTRIATTIMADGERIIGTQLDFDIAGNIREGREDYFETYNILGRNYNAFFHPITDSKNEVFAVIVAGVSSEELIRERNRLIINNTIIGLAGLIVSIIMMFHIITKSTRPIKKLVNLVSDVTHGNSNVNPDKAGKNIDEIAALTSDIFSIVEQLRETADRAHAASFAKSAFLANMSHEIRTPMNSIMGFSELALDDVIPAKTREYLSKILENTKGLLQIINDILDISKVESGRMELENIPFDMHELFESCRALILPKVVEKGIVLYFYAEPSIGKMPLGDPTRLRQVLVNLISNAVNFTDTGAVKVFAKIKEKSDKGVKVYFEIKDSGIGMTQDQIVKIFDSFIQAEPGTTRKFGGTGLGLTITKGIVELMGGDLSVESIPGVGSKFFFTVDFDTINVPIATVHKKKFAIDEYEKPVFNGEILLCEDNVMNQQVICEHLARVGLRTVVAWNGRIGFDMVRRRTLSEEKQFDLIFMDMHMPVMDGLEASAKILELNTGIPIVAMTANVMQDDKEIYRANGLQDCISKPFTSQELWGCLLKYLMPVNAGGQNTTIQDNTLLEADLLYKKALQQYFLQNNQNKFREIEKIIKEGDIKLAHRLVHNLKSNASQLGKESLKQAAIEVEHQLRDGKNLTTEEQMKTLEAELNIFLEELKARLSES